MRRIEFAGLRRIAASTLGDKIGSREGQPLDPQQVARDLRALDATGWFESASVEVEELVVRLAAAGLDAPPLAAPAQQPRIFLPQSLRLIFVLEERPWLARFDFRGSRLLNRKDCETALAGRGVRLKTAAPADRALLYKAAKAIEGALAERGHPRAQVRVMLREMPGHSVRATFLVDDGPRLEVAEVVFTGNAAFDDAELGRQMQRVAPRARLAGARGKTIYTPARLAEDLDRLENYYRSHGFAEARLGRPEVEILDDASIRRWFPWPRRERRPGLRVSIPVEEGPRYTVAAVELDVDLLPVERMLLPPLRALRPGDVYSPGGLLGARDELAAQLRAAPQLPRSPDPAAARPEVEALTRFDREAATVRVTLRARMQEPYIVRRIEFTGHHRFGDRYYRRRILLREGDPLDLARLERGLASLAGDGFIRPVTREDIDLRLDEATRSAELTIRLTEIGRQRISLVGGAGSFSSTLGVAYAVFDFFGGEELITGHFEGGPESVQLLARVAREGVFGTRATMGLSVLHHVLRPRLAGRERLFTSRARGALWEATLPLTPRDTLELHYEISHSSTDLRLPADILGAARGAIAATARSVRREAGAAWTHHSGGERMTASAGVSGGWLGGDENLLRAALEYARLEADPLTGGRNSWAMRTTVAGLASYAGPTPLHRRYFGGEQLVRGFRTGGLTPYGVSRVADAGGAERLVAAATGANLLGAFNGEYRVPLRAPYASRGAGHAAAVGARVAEAALFLDAGAGWLVPQWLGGNRPQLVSGTSGLLRASAGVELRLPLPLLAEPVRVYYAVNPLRMASSVLLPDGSPFRAPDRLTALGWGLGRLF